MNGKTTLVPVLMLLLLPSIASAATYYIDFDNGNDANSGLSTSSPWKTIPGTMNTIPVSFEDFKSTSWGPSGSAVFDYSHKVPAGTTFKLKGGSVHDGMDGGYIFINPSFYQNGNKDNPIAFELDTTWGSGPAVIDATGMTVPEALIVIRQIDGVKFDGIVQRGIVIRNSPLTGIRFKSVMYSTPVKDPVVRNLLFYNNGNSITSDTDGAGTAGLHFRNTVGGSVSSCEFDGNDNFVLGFLGGEGHESATNLTVSNCIAYNHKGDLVTDDSGIGFKAQNSQITFYNMTSYNNLKGFDLGEVTGDNRNIIYKIINCEARNNTWGMNLNSVADLAYTGNVSFYLTNNIVRDNPGGGSNIYGGPSNLYMVHNVYENNGNPNQNYQYNIRVTSDGCNDETIVQAHLYNNIFYKPNTNNKGMNLQVGYVADGITYDTNFSLDSDYNSWVQSSAGETFCNWAFNACTERCTDCTYTHLYGANGPGHASGIWYSQEDEPGAGTGHLHSDANSKGTGATDTTLPPFANVASHDYTLTSGYAGLDLSTKPWYIPEMGVDRNGNTRTSWDIGAYEYSPQQTCSQLGGACCSSGQQCSGSSTTSSDCSSCCIGVCQTSGLTSVSRNTDAITLDASLTEYEGIPFTIPHTRGVFGDQPTTDANCSAEFRSLWDSNNLYLGIKVTDDVINTNTVNIWEGDSIEIYIDSKNDKMKTYNSSGDYDYQFIINASDHSEAFRGGSPIAMPPGFQHSTITIPGGYVTEVKIPFSSLGIVPSMDLMLGFDVGINDNDGTGRSNQIMWNGTGDNFKDTSTFGSITLMSCSRSDTDCNTCVDLSEMIAFMDRWKISSTDVPMPHMMESIGLWKSGTGCS